MMLLSCDALTRVDQHWAVLAVGAPERSRGEVVSKIRLVRSAVGHQMAIVFDEEPSDGENIGRLAMAYEVAAIEGLDALLHPSGDPEREHLSEQAMAGAFRAYELRRSLPVPSGPEDRVFHVLHLAALAYCGDQWVDLRRWLSDHGQETKAPSVADADWEHRILYRLFDCWIRLLRKQGWDDLDGIREIIAGLRDDQKDYEGRALAGQDDDVARAVALRLVALYHWAKATELLAVFTLQGQPVGVDADLDKHFEAAQMAAQSARDLPMEVLLRWLHVTARRMVAGSLWRVAQAVNSRVSRFVRSVTKARSLFELLPPQRAALQEQGLLDQASRAVVVDLPTSGGKTTLAQFRMLQALNQFDADAGWVAYVAPTRALVAQLTRRMREDFGPLGIRVEQLSGAVEVDVFEEALLAAPRDQRAFDILVSTPEKLQFVIRNQQVGRPLALVVMDEAHNIEDEERGLRMELLLATIKRDCASANFLLLMPYVPNAADLARWLGGESGKTISIGTSAWQPNERAVGMFSILRDASVRGGWTLVYETLVTTPKTIHLQGQHQAGSVRPLDIPFSEARSLCMQAGAMAKVFSERGTSIAIAQTIPHVWSMARAIRQSMPRLGSIPPELGLVQRFLQTEISEDFELVEMLSHGVGVHHAGLSDEARALIEWLSEIGALRVLCATTTLAQGINFPVSSLFLATRLLPYGREMSTRAFWNLAGRAGRINQESVGVVGLAAGEDPGAVRRYVSHAVGDLVSRLVGLLDEVERAGRLNDLSLVISDPQWSAFRSYVAHLWNEKKNLDAVLAETEQLLRNTLGYGVLRTRPDEESRRKTQALLQATSTYARYLADHPGPAALADATGFAPEGVASAMAGLNQAQRKLTPSDWEPASLFSGAGSSSLAQLMGIMLRIPDTRVLQEISSEGLSHRRIADLMHAWVSGRSIKDIAAEFFGGGDTAAITKTCKAVFKVLTNIGPWGVSALSKISASSPSFADVPDDVMHRINSLPAMIYHGVGTEAAVLMRMSSVPRSVAEPLGAEFERSSGKFAHEQSTGVAREFLRSLSGGDWARAAPAGSAMSGVDYRDVWLRLSGEASS